MELDDDVDDSITKVMDKLAASEDYEPTSEELESLMIYYVAITRHRHHLKNAKYLNSYKEI